MLCDCKRYKLHVSSIHKDKHHIAAKTRDEANNYFNSICFFMFFYLFIVFCHKPIQKPRIIAFKIAPSKNWPGEK